MADKVIDELGPIEFAPWPTGLENDELHLVDVVYGDGSFDTTFAPEKLRVGIPATRSMAALMVANVFSFEKRALFQISCSSVSAFRVLDEHGLLELWGADQTGRSGSTFRVRNHSWAKESYLSFLMADTDYSYVVATDWDCLEIVCRLPPNVELVRYIDLEPFEGDPNDLVDRSDPIDTLIEKSGAKLQRFRR